MGISSGQRNLFRFGSLCCQHRIDTSKIGELAVGHVKFRTKERLYVYAIALFGLEGDLKSLLQAEEI